MSVAAVVGGTGFLGRHVVAALEQAGYSVRVLSRRTGFDALRPDPEALRGVNAVVNLAGIKREEGNQTFQAIHVDLVEQLVEAMKAADVRRLVHVSVVVARPDAVLPYHDTKWRGEQVVRSSGLDWTILRPGVIYGDGDDMLAHLTLMIRTAAVFPIVGSGSAPMRPVDVRDVALAVTAALRHPCSGQTYDIVGPDRLTLRDVVEQVAKAMDLPVMIWPTPAALLRLPVWIMEATMRQPLSTRAQLSMLAEGLDGDPGLAARDLGITTAPFTVDRLRPLVASVARTAPLNFRLRSAPARRREIGGMAFWTLLMFSVVALIVVFRFHLDPWAGVTAAMGMALAGALCLEAVRRRFKPTLFRLVAGLLAGAVQVGVTHAVTALFPLVWPEWEAAARTLYAWSNGHAPLFLGSTLVLAVTAEEALWRGVVARFLIERWGRTAGIVAAAAIYALAHLAALNPLLLMAAFACGIFWGWLYVATDDLVVPTVSHLVWDLALFFAFPVVH
jgi:uncharacterized protein YbjT (DUF2867 family)/membrane protease YdiL (CAAX protease family)